MSTSRNTQTRRVHLQAAAPSVEIFVLDLRGKVLLKGVETAEGDLSVGIYKVRTRIGKSVADDLVEVPPGDGDCFIQLKKLPLISPIPGCVDGEENQRSLAQAWSLQVSVNRASGGARPGRIFVFLQPCASASEPNLKVELRDANGVILATLANFSNDSGCRGCTVELDPGTYLLTVEGNRSSDGLATTLEQSIHVSAGWQTQLFVPCCDEGQDVPNLSDSAVLMSPVEAGFQFDKDLIIRAEAARQALSAKRGFGAPTSILSAAVQQATAMENQGFDDATIAQMLREKFIRPMTGIYGAYLLTLQEKPNLDLLRDVVRNLTRLVGDHPDVRALSMYLDSSGSYSFPVPPMLRCSWRVVCEHSIKTGTVPPRSYSARIGSNLWGSGSLLAWRAPEPEDANAQPGEEVADTHELDPDHILQLAQDAISSMSRLKLTPAQKVLMTYFRGMLAREDFAKRLTHESDDEGLLGAIMPMVRHMSPGVLVEQTQKDNLEAMNLEKIAASTGIPFTSIVEGAHSLAVQLGRRPETSRLAALLKRLIPSGGSSQ